MPSLGSRKSLNSSRHSLLIWKPEVHCHRHRKTFTPKSESVKTSFSQVQIEATGQSLFWWKSKGTLSICNGYKLALSEKETSQRDYEEADRHDDGVQEGPNVPTWIGVREKTWIHHYKDTDTNTLVTLKLFLLSIESDYTESRRQKPIPHLQFKRLMTNENMSRDFVQKLESPRNLHFNDLS